MTNPLLRERVLQILAEQLDSALLEQLFPGYTVDDIRRLITGAQIQAAENSPTVLPVASSPPAKALGMAAAGCCKLFTDGASRGNPGQAGAGAVLFAENGEELVAQSVYLGICTNNVAEYKALLVGLQEALQFGCTELVIALDSELIVRQIQGRYKVKNEALQVLFHEVRASLARFRKWSIMHVPRAQNARADQLANNGIDQRDNQE